MTGVISADLASNQWCDFRVFLPKVANVVECMVSSRVAHFSVAESPVCEVFSSLSNPPSKLLHKVWLAQLADINARIPLLLAAVIPLGLELDLAAHQGVVCIAVRAVIRACVENFLNGGLSDQNEIQLVPVF